MEEIEWDLPKFRINVNDVPQFLNVDQIEKICNDFLKNEKFITIVFDNNVAILADRVEADIFHEDRISIFIKGIEISYLDVRNIKGIME